MFCKNCGAKLADGAKFCPSCGTPTGISSPPEVHTHSHEESKATPTPASVNPSTTDKAGVNQPKAEAEKPIQQEDSPKAVKKSPIWKKLLIGVAAMLVFIFVTGIFSGDDSEPSGSGDIQSSTSPEPSADILIESDGTFGLAFNMSTDEFISGYNEKISEILNAYLAQDIIDEETYSYLEGAGIYLTEDQLNYYTMTNDYGENFCCQLVYDNQSGTFIQLLLTEFDNNVTSYMVGFGLDSESQTLGLLMLSAALATTDPEQFPTIDEALEKVDEWHTEVFKKLNEGETELSYYVDNICYEAKFPQDTLSYFVRPMSNDGFALWSGQGSDSKNDSESATSNGPSDEEILDVMKELPIYGVDVRSDTLFAVIGAENWKVVKNYNPFQATVSGNGMSFTLELDVESYNYIIKDVTANGNLYTGDAKDALCDSLLESAYDACQAGYTP